MTAPVSEQAEILSAEELRTMDAYWRACNYLCAGMIYLHDNPLLREPLKPRPYQEAAAWATGAPTPARLCLGASQPAHPEIRPRHDLYRRSRSRRARNAVERWMEGTYSEIYPDKSRTIEGMQKFFREFSFPGGIGSHCTPETPGSIHEGGELGYSLSHAFGAAFDNPDLIVLSWSEMAKRKPARWRRRGTPTNSSIPCAMVQCCPSCT